MTYTLTFRDNTSIKIDCFSFKQLGRCTIRCYTESSKHGEDSVTINFPVEQGGIVEIRDANGIAQEVLC